MNEYVSECVCVCVCVRVRVCECVRACVCVFVYIARKRALHLTDLIFSYMANRIVVRSLLMRCINRTSPKLIPGHILMSLASKYPCKPIKCPCILVHTRIPSDSKVVEVYIVTLLSVRIVNRLGHF